MSNDVKRLANEIRLELLAELRAARSESVVESIKQRAEALNLIDLHDFGATLLSAPATVAEPKIHMCPAQGSATTPCCGISPFELPGTDRLTRDEASVTCGNVTVHQS